MRIIQMVNVRWYNATAWYGVTLADIFQKHGHESMVVGLPSSPPIKVAQSLGLKTFVQKWNSLSPIELVKNLIGIIRICRKFKPDVVNCHRGESFILWALCRPFFHYALIRTRGDRRLPKTTIINRWLHEKMTNAVIVTNSLMRKFFEENFNMEGKLHTILGGVDTDRFKPSLKERIIQRSQYGFTDDDFVLGILGRMDEVKGIPETIEAVSLTRKIFQEKKRLCLLIIGFESQYSLADIERFSEQYGLKFGDDVIVTGKVPYPERVINALDAGIVSSTYSEAIARAALEIMSTGIPLISSTTGVMPDLVPRRFLFEPGDKETMALCIHELFDFAAGKKLAEYCYSKIQSDLTFDKFYDKTYAVYDSAITQHN